MNREKYFLRSSKHEWNMAGSDEDVNRDRTDSETSSALSEHEETDNPMEKLMAMIAAMQTSQSECLRKLTETTTKLDEVQRETSNTGSRLETFQNETTHKLMALQTESTGLIRQLHAELSADFNGQLVELRHAVREDLDQVCNSVNDRICSITTEVKNINEEVSTLKSETDEKFSGVLERLSGQEQALNDINLEMEQVNSRVLTMRSENVNFQDRINASLERMETRLQSSSILSPNGNTGEETEGTDTLAVHTTNLVPGMPPDTNPFPGLTSNTLSDKQMSSLTFNPPATILHHPAKHWSRELPIFQGKTSENPMAFIKHFDEYVALFGLTEKEALKCLNLCLKSTAYFWWEIERERINSYDEFKDSFRAQFWNAQVQGNLRARMHSERFDPKKGKGVEEHLSEVYERSRNLSPPMDDTEFVAMVIGQLPYRYQIQWAGRLPGTLAEFREQLINYDRLDKQMRASGQNQLDRIPGQQPRSQQNANCQRGEMQYERQARVNAVQVQSPRGGSKRDWLERGQEQYNQPYGRNDGYRQNYRPWYRRDYRNWGYRRNYGYDRRNERPPSRERRSSRSWSPRSPQDSRSPPHYGGTERNSTVNDQSHSPSNHQGEAQLNNSQAVGYFQRQEPLDPQAKEYRPLQESNYQYVQWSNSPPLIANKGDGNPNKNLNN